MFATALKELRVSNQDSLRIAILWVLFIAYAWVLTQMYVVEMPSSPAGMNRWEMTPGRWFCLIVGLVFLAWITSRVDGRPSDFFVLLYGGIVVNSFMVLHPIAGPMPATVVAWAAIILCLPLVILEVFKKAFPPLRFTGWFKGEYIEGCVALALIAVMFLAYVRAPTAAGFALGDMYVRRLEGRDLYPAGSFLAYGLAMGMNGFAPYLAFRAALKYRVDLLALSVVAPVFFFWLIGVKAPFLYVAVSFALGFVVRNTQLSMMRYSFVVCVLALYVGVLMEAYWIRGNSLASYFFMRMFASHAEVQGFYFKFLFEPKAIPWSWLTGTADSSLAMTYFIGEHYAGNAANNSNTSAFLYQLAAKGVMGYLIAAVFVPAFLVIIDRLWQASRNPSYLFLGFLYALLVVEQAFTVAMVSSGVGVLFMLTLLEKHEKLHKIKDFSQNPPGVSP